MYLLEMYDEIYNLLNDESNNKIIIDANNIINSIVDNMEVYYLHFGKGNFMYKTKKYNIYFLQNYDNNYNENYYEYILFIIKFLYENYDLNYNNFIFYLFLRYSQHKFTNIFIENIIKEFEIDIDANCINNLIELINNKLYVDKKTKYETEQEYELYIYNFGCDAYDIFYSLINNNLINKITKSSYNSLAYILCDLIYGYDYEYHKNEHKCKKLDIDYNHIFTHERLCNLIIEHNGLSDDFLEFLDKNDVEYDYDKLIKFANEN